MKVNQGTPESSQTVAVSWGLKIPTRDGVRLIISCPNSIYTQKNYNGGGTVAQESGQDARTAHVTLYHDAERASYLDLPVVR